MRTLQYVCICLLLLMIGCRKFVTVPAPVDQLSGDKLFSSDAGATSALSGAYADISYSTNWTGMLTRYLSEYADELQPTAPADMDQQFFSDFVLAGGYQVSGWWRYSYYDIFIINSILDRLPRSTGITPATRDRIYGQCLFLRAYLYFNLINIFGDVPYVQNTNYPQTEHIGRTPADTVYKHITADLLTAISLLPEQYTGSGKAQANKWAAVALLARVYLYQDLWQQAYDNSSGLLQNDEYALNTLNEIFLTNSSESIWQLELDYPLNNDANTFVPSDSTVLPDFVLSKSLLNSFESEDQRRIMWTGKNIVSGNEVYYPKKYRFPNNTQHQEGYVLLRLGEQYLIHAEAAAHLDKAQEAIDDLNELRHRAGLNDLPPLTRNALLQAIESERQKELFVELGYRFFDLKRTNRLDQIGVNKNQPWRAEAALFPIPNDELKANPLLFQNAGY